VKKLQHLEPHLCFWSHLIEEVRTVEGSAHDKRGP
jgi:hypothetical protein